MNFKSVTIPATGVTAIVSGYIGEGLMTMEAHPSNAGIIYVKRTADTDLGYPLAAGATLRFMEEADITNYVVSGVVGGRLTVAYE